MHQGPVGDGHGRGGDHAGPHVGEEVVSGAEGDHGLRVPLDGGGGGDGGQ